MARAGPAEAAAAFEFGVCRFRDVGKVDSAIQHMLFALFGSPAAR
jgi:hypothetical protein